MTVIRQAVGRFVDWLERGDLIPVLIVVSAFHYAVVLAAHDPPVVAVAIGLLVDLGHYRTIRAAIRYNGDDRRHAIARWMIAAGMTALSLNYHQRYYSDWWLSAPLPAMIAALAWLQRVDGSAVRKASERKAIEPERKAIESDSIEIAKRLPAPQSERKAIAPAHACVVCGRMFGTPQALVAHGRVHKKIVQDVDDHSALFADVDGE